MSFSDELDAALAAIQCDPVHIDTTQRFEAQKGRIAEIIENEWRLDDETLRGVLGQLYACIDPYDLETFWRRMFHFQPPPSQLKNVARHTYNEKGKIIQVWRNAYLEYLKQNKTF